jgi:hypothetical protein
LSDKRAAALSRRRHVCRQEFRVTVSSNCAWRISFGQRHKASHAHQPFAAQLFKHAAKIAVWGDPRDCDAFRQDPGRAETQRGSVLPDAAMGVRRPSKTHHHDNGRTNGPTRGEPQ